MTKTTQMQSGSQTGTQQQQQAALDRGYGKVGIPAVAAAMRYQSSERKTVKAPTFLRDDD